MLGWPVQPFAKLVPIGMADISAFRGLVYQQNAKELSSRLAPPYDVIDDAYRQKLLAKDKNNCAGLILPEGEGDQKYDNALSLLQSWQNEGVLQRDDNACFYRYHQVFTHSACGSEAVTRRGFIAAVRLHDFDERVILRHERTLKGPKVDRLKLWDKTRCHLSQIFALYSDPKRISDGLFETAESLEPDLEGTTDDGTLHRLWKVNDAETIQSLTDFMKEKKLYIADGHHRYETMLALRNRIREEGHQAPLATSEFGMMFLANLDDPGLIVLPTHRLIHDVKGFDRETLCSALAEFFDIHEVDAADADASGLRAKLAEAGAKRISFACVFAGQKNATLLTVKERLDYRGIGLGTSEVLNALDVHVLHGLVFEKILGITKAAQEAKTNIYYLKDFEQALLRIHGGEGQACFFMNEPPVSQIVAVSDADEVMPQKSTFFYPKIASGTVFYPVEVNEEL